jgi:hypothetical protein
MQPSKQGVPLVATDSNIYFVSHRTCQSQPESICHSHAPLTVILWRQILRLGLAGSPEYPLKLSLDLPPPTLPPSPQG